MKKRLSGCLVLISVMVAVLLSAGSPAFASGYDTNANLKTGDVYNAHFETVTDQTMTGDGANQKPAKFTTVEKMNVLLTVQNVDQDHNATIQCKFTALTFSGPMLEMSRWVEQFAGKIFSAKVNSRGEVLEIKAVDTAVEWSYDTAVDLSYPKHAMKMIFATLNGHFPQKSVQVGDTWDDTANIEMTDPLITFKSNWKFVSDKDGILTVEGKGNVSASNGQTDTSGATVHKMNCEGDDEVTLRMHKDHLFVQTGIWTEHVKETMEEQNQGQTVKVLMTSESKMTFEITKQ